MRGHGSFTMPPPPRPSPAPNNDRASAQLPSNAINPLPISFKPRRRKQSSSRPSLFTANRRRRTTINAAPHSSSASAPLDADDLAIAALSNITDTHVAVQTLKAQWPDEARSQLPRTPPVILRSQIHALIADPTIIEHELAKLVTDGVICQIRVPFSSVSLSLSSCDVSFRRDAYVVMSDMRALQINDTSSGEDSTSSTTRRTISMPTFETFLDSVMPRARNGLVDWHVFESAFQHHQLHLQQRQQKRLNQQREKSVNMADVVTNAVDELVKAGFLTMHSEHTYALCVPGLAVFDENRACGHKQLLRQLKSAQYHELPLSKLELQTIKNTMFTAQWHVRDLVGSGVAHTVSTTVGTLVRMSHPPE